MSTSSATIAKRHRALPHRKYNDGMTTAQFKRLFAQRHREFFRKRKIDPEAIRTSANFEGRFDRKTER